MGHAQHKPSDRTFRVIIDDRRLFEVPFLDPVPIPSALLLLVGLGIIVRLLLLSRLSLLPTEPAAARTKPESPVPIPSALLLLVGLGVIVRLLLTRLSLLPTLPAAAQTKPESEQLLDIDCRGLLFLLRGEYARRSCVIMTTDATSLIEAATKMPIETPLQAENSNNDPAIAEDTA